MKQEKKFIAGEQQTPQTQLQSESRQTIHEFATPEEVLRFDAKQTVMPDGITRRLARSLERVRPRPWWKRWFG